MLCLFVRTVQASRTPVERCSLARSLSPLFLLAPSPLRKMPILRPQCLLRRSFTPVLNTHRSRSALDHLRSSQLAFDQTRSALGRRFLTNNHFQRLKMPSDKPEIITAYDVRPSPRPSHLADPLVQPQSYITNSSQTLPGKDVDMSPLAEHTRVERWTREGKPYLEEYRGCGKLEGKAAIVTGGDSGIGRSVSVFFAREGADVTIVYLPVEEEE